MWLLSRSSALGKAADASKSQHCAMFRNAGSVLQTTYSSYVTLKVSSSLGKMHFADIYNGSLASAELYEGVEGKERKRKIISFLIETKKRKQER